MSMEPVTHVDDLRRKKVWVPEGDEISYMVMQSMGLSPVQLPVTDVLTGLQTGLLDVVAAAPLAALVLQWHTRVKHRTELPVSYSMGVFAVDARVFNRLTAADQAVVRDVMRGVMVDIDSSARDDDREAREVMTHNGVQPVAVNASDVMSWRQTIESLYPEIRRRPDIDGALFDEMLGLLEEYRANPGVAGLKTD